PLCDPRLTNHREDPHHEPAEPAHQAQDHVPRAPTPGVRLRGWPDGLPRVRPPCRPPRDHRRDDGPPGDLRVGPVVKTPEEVAREVLGNIAGPLRHIFGDAAWLDALDVLLAQEAEHLADLIRAR